MRKLAILLSLFIVGCTSPYPMIDNPGGGSNSAENQQIIDYINQRLSQEYYWLDEVEEKRGYFNTYQSWDKYLDDALRKLETNVDDGYLNSKGQRVFYSYIRELPSTTRAEVMGLGIDLHYTIVVIDSENGYYGFIVENVYPDSPAAAAGIKRGDIITKINNGHITAANYVAFFNNIQLNKPANVDLQLLRRAALSKDEEQFKVSLNKGAYAETPVIYSEVIEVEGYDKKIGYLVYTGFESEYDEEMLSVLGGFASEGVQEVILDLRCNGGGSLNSAIKLCSALMPNSYEGGTLCSVTRNPRNVAHNQETASIFPLQHTGEVLCLERLTVICSQNSASASELVVMGMRGLDFPVTLIGTTTQGKNCGMDVTRRKIGSKQLEYAPITFMCFNAKGFGDWGNGIEPDIDLTANNDFGVKDELYPLPAADWGNAKYDIALAVALAEVTGKSVSVGGETRSSTPLTEAVTIEAQFKGICVYVDEQ